MGTKFSMMTMAKDTIKGHTMTITPDERERLRDKIKGIEQGWFPNCNISTGELRRLLDYVDSLEETIAVMSDKEAMAALELSRRDVEEGKVHSQEDVENELLKSVPIVVTKVEEKNDSTD